MSQSPVLTTDTNLPLKSTNCLPSSRADEGSKCSSYLYESISDPEFAMSGEPGHCSLAKAFNYDKALWDFYEEPSQKHRLYRFGVAMEGVKRFEPPDLAVDGDGQLYFVFDDSEFYADIRSSCRLHMGCTFG